MRRNIDATGKSPVAYWIVYILVLTCLFIIACILSYHSLDETTSANIFKIVALLPPLIYLIESLCTRGKYVEIFSEIERLNSILRSPKQKHVMQLSRENVAKIIALLSLFIAQLAIISVKCFVYETFALEVQVDDIISR